MKTFRVTTESEVIETIKSDNHFREQFYIANGRVVYKCATYKEVHVYEIEAFNEDAINTLFIDFVSETIGSIEMIKDEPNFFDALGKTSSGENYTNVISSTKISRVKINEFDEPCEQTIQDRFKETGELPIVDSDMFGFIY